MWSAAAEEAGGHFCIKRRRRDLELCVSQETWHQREEATEDKGLFVDPAQKERTKESKRLGITVME